jgi:Cd(II)/Pb(II)-responsive transcriptional regulator
MHIGELAKRAGVRADTVRHYEKTGLLPAPPRRPNGYRDFDEQHLERLAFIRHCRNLGMSLEDVRRLLEFIARPEADCDAVDRLIGEQIARVQARLASLRTLEQQLQVLRTQCGTPTSVSECGILQVLVAAAQDEGRVCHPATAEEHGDSNGE